MSDNYSTPPMSPLERQTSQESQRLAGQHRLAIRHIRRALAHLLLCEPNDVRSELRAALVTLGDEDYLRRTKYRTCDKCHGMGVVMTGEGTADCSCGLGQP